MGQQYRSSEHLDHIRRTGLQQRRLVERSRTSSIPSRQQHHLGPNRHRSTTTSVVCSSSIYLGLRPSTICSRSHWCSQRPHRRSLWCRPRRYRGPRALSAIASRASLDCDNASSTNCVFDTSRSCTNSSINWVANGVGLLQFNN
jgi:hypothetical protein